MESLQNFLLLILGCLVTIERLLRRADREAEGARLLSEYAPKGHLGFESPALRQYEFEKGSHLGPFFYYQEWRLGIRTREGTGVKQTRKRL